MHSKLSLGLMLLSLSAYSQISFNNPDESSIVNFQTINRDLSQLEAKGSPYMEEDYKYGQVYIGDKLGFTGDLRYNAYSSEIEIFVSDDEYSAVLKRAQFWAKIGDKEYRILPFLDKNEQKRVGYFNPLNEGSYQLLFKPEKKLRKARAAATSYDRDFPPTYVDASAYYLKIKDKPAYRIYLSKREFYQEFGKDKVKAILNSKKINPNKAEGAIELLNELNQSAVSNI